MSTPSFEELYRMKDHEILQFQTASTFTNVIRVPHGWIYITMDKSAGVMSSVFVPMLNIKGEE